MLLLIFFVFAITTDIQAAENFFDDVEWCLTTDEIEGIYGEPNLIADEIGLSYYYDAYFAEIRLRKVFSFSPADNTLLTIGLWPREQYIDYPEYHANDYRALQDKLEKIYGAPDDYEENYTATGFKEKGWGYNIKHGYLEILSKWETSDTEISHSIRGEIIMGELRIGHYLSFMERTTEAKKE